MAEPSAECARRRAPIPVHRSSRSWPACRWLWQCRADHHHWKTRLSQFRRVRRLVAAGGFQNNQFRLALAKPLGEFHNPRRVVSKVPASCTGEKGHIEVLLRDVNADERML